MRSSFYQIQVPSIYILYSKRVRLNNFSRKLLEENRYDQLLITIWLYKSIPFSVRLKYRILQTIFKSSSCCSVASDEICCIHDIINNTIPFAKYFRSFSFGDTLNISFFSKFSMIWLKCIISIFLTFD